MIRNFIERWNFSNPGAILRLVKELLPQLVRPEVRRGQGELATTPGTTQGEDKARSHKQAGITTSEAVGMRSNLQPWRLLTSHEF